MSFLLYRGTRVIQSGWRRTGDQKEALLSALVDGLASYIFDCPLRVFLPNQAISDCMFRLSKHKFLHFSSRITSLLSQWMSHSALSSWDTQSSSRAFLAGHRSGLPNSGSTTFCRTIKYRPPAPISTFLHVAHGPLLTPTDAQTGCNPVRGHWDGQRSGHRNPLGGRFHGFRVG